METELHWRPNLGFAGQAALARWSQLTPPNPWGRNNPPARIEWYGTLQGVAATLMWQLESAVTLAEQKASGAPPMTVAVPVLGSRYELAKKLGLGPYYRATEQAIQHLYRGMRQVKAPAGGPPEGWGDVPKLPTVEGAAVLGDPTDVVVKLVGIAATAVVGWHLVDRACSVFDGSAIKAAQLDARLKELQWRLVNNQPLPPPPKDIADADREAAAKPWLWGVFGLGLAAAAGGGLYASMKAPARSSSSTSTTTSSAPERVSNPAKRGRRTKHKSRKRIDWFARGVRAADRDCIRGHCTVDTMIAAENKLGASIQEPSRDRFRKGYASRARARKRNPVVKTERTIKTTSAPASKGKARKKKAHKKKASKKRAAKRAKPRKKARAKKASKKAKRKKNPARHEGGYYIVDTRTGKVTEGPYSVAEADEVLAAKVERGAASYRTHQVIGGRYLTDKPFKNPLKAGYSEATLRANVGELVRHGRSRAQAAAIAYRAAREAYRKRYRRGPFPAYLAKAPPRPKARAAIRRRASGAKRKRSPRKIARAGRGKRTGKK